MEPIEPVLKNIYLSNTYRVELSWPHFDEELKIHQQSFIFVFVAFAFVQGMELQKKKVKEIKAYGKSV